MRYARRWSAASKALLGLSVALALAAFLIVRGYAGRLEALRPAVGPPVRVLVAAADLARGTRLEASMLTPVEVPTAFAPPGGLTDAASVDGRVLLAPLEAGEVLTDSRLSAAGEGPVAALVPPGLRAFAIEAAIPAEAVRAGDRVDVLATFGGGRPYTETVAAGLEVLLVLDPAGPAAVAGLGEASGGGVSLVLLVGPEQAERLAYARAFADLAVSIGGEPADPGGI